MSRRKMDNTCAGCSWQTKIWQYLGWKPYCKRYRAIRDQKCIDFTLKTGKIPISRATQ